MKNNDTAFQYLVSLANECQQNSNLAHPQEKRKQDWFGLGFLSDSIHFVTKTTFIEAVIPFANIYKLPISHPGLLGMCQYQNRVFPVVDLQGLFWPQNEKSKQNSKIIIYRFYDQWIGILVCACFGIKRFEMSLRQQVELNQKAPYAPFVQFAFYESDKRWAVLDLFKLINTFSAQKLAHAESN